MSSVHVRLIKKPIFSMIMKNLATIKLKIPKNKELLALSDNYLKACQYAADKAFETKCQNKYTLHHLIYYDLRKLFNLKSQFAINAIARGYEAYSSCKKKVCIKHMPVRFDRRTFTFLNDKISLTTNDKRCVIPLNIPSYYQRYLSWRYQTADIFLDKQGRLFLNITFSKEINANVSVARLVGVDLGVNNLAVTSDGQVFKSPKTQIKQFQFMRRKLQAKGTKSARKHLRMISGRQKRFMAWVNHNVSKQIVSRADCIVLENLKGIRKARNKHMGKRLNRWLNSWSFYQLQSFIQYKAEAMGKTVQFVNPYMTSQTCSNCGELGSRYGSSFVCLHCNYDFDADFNASCNLRRLHVTQPNVSNDDGKGRLTSALEFGNNQLPKA